MEKRIGTILIQVNRYEVTPEVNTIISKYANVIIGRQGIHIRDKGFSIISLLIEATTDDIGALSGQLGLIKGIQVKTAVLK